MQRIVWFHQMSSTLQPPKKSYLAYNLVIETYFNIPFLPRIKNRASDIQFIPKKLEQIPNRNFYSLSKDKSEYCKKDEVRAVSNKLNIDYEVLNGRINQYDMSFKAAHSPSCSWSFFKKRFSASW